MTVINIDHLLDTEPDQAFVRQDDSGRALFSFAIEYRMDNARWAASIWAYSHEDAEARVKAMKETLALCGQVFCEVPG
ncbi:hypothetical protein ATY81_22445 [Rhizobium sp. R72]|uniref:hypothetical protein n=1 Tax=unclassified Rhizobium TaxID=2613769 RepID=UPI000B537518|nr:MULTISPECIES: hypothetical protein [unclassified Rhizobium]OWW02398.1 hypothetical protein ATY81_22445 [Rhizobium sp. R72]OWW02532.1 hypothetical protein ATY80_22445 [Rhizobium sp. R711]